MFRKNIIIFFSDIIAILFITIKRIFVSFKLVKKENVLRIIVYHSVLKDSFYKDMQERNVSLNMFRQHMQFIKKTSSKIVSIRQATDALIRNELPQSCIAITFDDGFEDVYDNAIGVLEELKIPAAFFIVSRFAEGESLQSYAGREERYMNWQQVISLKERGFEIGSHSYSHVSLSALNDQELFREIMESKKCFKDKGMQADYFSYPFGFYGDFSERVEKVIKKAGYKACLTNIMGENKAGDNLFRIKRTRISWRDNAFRFWLKINGAYDWVDTIKYKLSILKHKSYNLK